MRVLLTGAHGFIGTNLQLRLVERKGVEIRTFTRSDDPDTLAHLLDGVDAVFHLAGVNRPTDPSEFETGNVGDTAALGNALQQSVNATGRRPVVLMASSIQSKLDNPYGRSKARAEAALTSAGDACGCKVLVFRLPNVFGKWARPNYNSAVATFCYNTARGLPIQINDPAASLRLVHIDDVVTTFLRVLDGEFPQSDADGFATVKPEYTTTVGEVAEHIQSFRSSRDTLMTERVGTGFLRALYSTYISYLPTESFAYEVPRHRDARGTFVEMLKTPDAGQFSFFTAHPGVTRGGHYHHTKTEKFLVIQGTALFGFRHMITGETYQVQTQGTHPTIVETVPGWAHDITNVGMDELIVMLWANEIFDREHPDTIASAVLEGAKQ